ncbi:MAG: hypothetical protein ACD_46C00222G0004 [uncultured bacterium]|nr:MAG: hypothetical protein ACD_46C00222G0004 [uncultured bacterium]
MLRTIQEKLENKTSQPGTLKIIQEALKKSVRRDGTAVINSMVQDEKSGDADYEKLTDDEKIAAGLLALFHGPVKITYGSLLTIAGIIFTLVPKVVMVVETEEIESEDGKKIANFKSISFRTRSTRTPLHYTRHEEKDLGEEKLLTTDREGWKFTRNIKFWDPEGVINDLSKFDNVQVKNIETTVTGYELATTGLGRMITGIVDPLRGLISAGFFGIKKIQNENKLKQPIEQEMQLIKKNN